MQVHLDPSLVQIDPHCHLIFAFWILGGGEKRQKVREGFSPQPTPKTREPAPFQEVKKLLPGLLCLLSLKLTGAKWLVG